MSIDPVGYGTRGVFPTIHQTYIAGYWIRAVCLFGDDATA